MAFRPMDVISIMWSHPILSAAVLLLFTPPLFPIVIYFSPLLISTALVVLAMVSMGTDENETPHYGNAGVAYKRNWIENKITSDDGPQLDDERVSKRLRASSRDETWFDKVKNWEGTGRAWMESVLNQESRRSFPSSEFHNAPVVSVRRLPSATEFFGEVLQKNTPAAGRIEGAGAGEIVVRDPQQQHEHKEQQLVLSQPAGGKGEVEEKEAVSKPAAEDESANNSVVPAELSESVDSRSLAVIAPGANVVSSEITPALETDDDDDDQRSSIEIPAAAAPRNVPPSPLFRVLSGPKAAADDHTGNVVVTEASSKVQDVSSKDVKDSSEPKQSLSVLPSSPSVTIEGERKKGLISNPAAENEARAAPTGLIKKEPAAECVGKGMTLSSLGKESNNNAQITGGEVKAERKISGPITERTSGSSLAAKTQTRISTDSVSESGEGQSDVAPEAPQQSPREAKSGAELSESVGPAVPGGTKAYGVMETPSATVALSEKLNVPLADMISLLAGEDKDNAIPNQTPSGVKASTSSETTTSQEEEWSSSDDGEQSSAAATGRRSVEGGAGPSSVPEINDG